MIEASENNHSSTLKVFNYLSIYVVSTHRLQKRFLSSDMGTSVPTHKRQKRFLSSDMGSSCPPTNYIIGSSLHI